MSESTIVVTGGYFYPQSQVTEYSGIGGDEVTKHKMHLLDDLIFALVYDCIWGFLQVLIQDLPPLITGRLFQTKPKLKKQCPLNSGGTALMLHPITPLSSDCTTPVAATQWESCRCSSLKEVIFYNYFWIKLLWVTFERCWSWLGGLLVATRTPQRSFPCGIPWNQLL